MLSTYVQQFHYFCISFPVVSACMQQLDDLGYKLGLVSNGKTPFQERNFYALGIQQYFSTVIVSDAVGLRKPDPAIFYLDCEKLGVEVERCVFVGDNKQVDIEGAMQAGLSAIHFCPSHSHDRACFDEQWQIMSSFSQIIECLEQINRS